MILRDYQLFTKEKVYAAWESGCKGVMCQMPTGTGKTVVAVDIIKEQTPSVSIDDSSLSMGSKAGAMRVLVVAHRKEILEQIKETLLRYGLGERIEDGSIVVESVQRVTKTKTITKTKTKTKTEAEPGLVIIDEAHHATAKTYRRLWEMFPKAKFLGMTATPCRMKAEGFDGLFDTLVCSMDVMAFMKEGWLSLYEYYAAKPNSHMLHYVRMLKGRGADGDYKVGEMESLMDNRASIVQLYRSYKEYADGKQGIIYAINREHATHIWEYFVTETKTETITSTETGTCGDDWIVVVDSATPKKERERINREYREGKVRILVNCDIYSEGYDAPFVQFIQLARPTLSLSKYLQQVGRGLRTHESKRATVILDCVGNCYRFGMPNEARDWTRMFHEGQQLTDLDSRIPSMESRNFRLLAMQPREWMDIDDGHDHEMQQMETVNGLMRELKRYVMPADLLPKASTERKVKKMAERLRKDLSAQSAKERDLGNDVSETDETNVRTLSDYEIKARKMRELKSECYPFTAASGLCGLKMQDKEVIPAMYKDITSYCDSYAVVTKDMYRHVLVNMRNEVVYQAHDVVSVLNDGVICVSMADEASHTDRRVYVDVLSKDFTMFPKTPVRRKVGKLNFMETEDGVYYFNVKNNDNLCFLAKDLRFNDEGVMVADSTDSNRKVTMVAFIDDEKAYVVQGYHRDGRMILKALGGDEFYLWNEKDMPERWNVNQRTMLMSMKKRVG